MLDTLYEFAQPQRREMNEYEVWYISHEVTQLGRDEKGEMRVAIDLTPRTLSLISAYTRGYAAILARRRLDTAGYRNAVLLAVTAIGRG